MSNRSSSVAFFPGRTRSRTTDVLARALRGLIEGLQSERWPCLIPRLEHLYEPRAGMPYHFKPELFIQVSGTTEFSFPDERITLQPGVACIVPRGLPHGEVARTAGGPFENIVVSFYNDTIYVHLAHERTPGRPGVQHVDFYTTNLFADLILYLDRIAELHHRDPRRYHVAIRALLVAELSLLLGVVDTPNTMRPPSNDTIAVCKWMIHQRLHDDQLNLDVLANELGCSPSYLSRLFHQKVGERIVEHINRLRIQNAIEALQQTRFSSKVIAMGCGYRDAGYFGRVFRQMTGRSPQQYRRDHQRSTSSLEMQPKTIYAAKKDFGAIPDLGELNAIDALRLTKLSVNAIAAGCGYRDAKLFSQFFKQATGSSPQKYRRDIQRLMAARAGGSAAPLQSGPESAKASSGITAPPKRRSA